MGSTTASASVLTQKDATTLPIHTEVTDELGFTDADGQGTLIEVASRVVPSTSTQRWVRRSSLPFNSAQHEGSNTQKVSVGKNTFSACADPEQVALQTRWRRSVR